MAEKHEQAEADYMTGMKYKDIAEKYGVALDTVKSWKKRHDWNRKEGAPQTKKVCTPKKSAPTVPDDGTKETLTNDDLTPEQQMFCIYYIRTFNAAQSYLRAYGCTYESAMVRGSELLRNIKVKAELERLKEIKRQQIVASAEDVVELQMRIAFSDIGTVLSFGRTEIETKTGNMIEVNTVDLKDSASVDTQLIESVKEGRDGVSVKLKDSQRAFDWLSKYFLMHPDDKYKAEFDKKRADFNVNTGEEMLKNMNAIADILQNPVGNRKIDDYE